MDRAPDQPVRDPLASTYQFRPDEVAFLCSLGLIELPDTLPHAKEIYLGIVRVRPGLGTARIWVAANPARFWRVDVLTCEDKLVRVHTASGSLKPRWGVIAAIANSEVEISLPPIEEDELPVVSLGQGTSHTEIKPAGLLPGGGR